MWNRHILVQHSDAILSLPPPILVLLLLLQEGTELYLIPAIDMINHSTDPALRNTTLHSYNVASSSSSGDVAAHKGPFFSMKAGAKEVQGPEQAEPVLLHHTLASFGSVVMLEPT